MFLIFDNNQVYQVILPGKKSRKKISVWPATEEKIVVVVYSEEVLDDDA